MKILFVARHFTYFRNYDSVLRELAVRGHRLHLVAEQREKQGGERRIAGLAAEHPHITYGVQAERESDPLRDLARRLRLGLDFVRYLEPFYDDAPLLRDRARERTPRVFVSLATPPRCAGAWWSRAVARVLHRCERSIPPPPSVTRLLEEQQPDALLITPLMDLGSQQIDFVRAARRMGIPTGLCVWSWDHLSSKAYLRDIPERVFVWNETQRREAIDIHGVPAAHVVVTGAQCFDQWFERQPSRSREAFCAEVGLPADRPLVLYVCSALIHGSPPEPPFVREWLERLRGSVDPLLATAAVLVRPHPSSPFSAADLDLAGLGPVAVWGSNPLDAQTRADYFDSLYHGAAVVGLNTSAFIEAAIAGRPVLAPLPPRFHDNQEGTIHFRYLLQVGGGMLRASSDLDAHLTRLAAAIAEPPSTDHPHRAFLEQFVRPHGLHVAATPVFVDAVETMGTRVTAVVGSVRSRAAWLMERAARVAQRPPVRAWLLSEREAASEAEFALRMARKIEERQQRLGAHDEARERRLARIAEERRRRQAQIEAKQRARHEKADRRVQRAGGHHGVLRRWRARTVEPAREGLRNALRLLVGDSSSRQP